MEMAAQRAALLMISFEKHGYGMGISLMVLVLVQQQILNSTGRMDKLLLIKK